MEGIIMSTDTLEQRLSAVETAIAELKQQTRPTAANWLEQITGSFKDSPIFDEVLAYGREFRYSDRPNDDERIDS
jgi:hypothetical protein